MLTSSPRPSGWEPAGPLGEPALPPDAGTIHGAFLHQAQASPDAPAVVHDGERLSYRQLADRATAYATGLRHRGVRPGDRVAVRMHRSADLIALLLGIMAAGAAYVPIDHSTPTARARQVIEDCAPALTVTDRPPADEQLPGRTLHPTALHPTTPPDTALHPTTLPALPDDAPAYLIYTSGSTGRPKGVVVPHRNVLALMRATAPGLGLGPDQVWSWFHSVAFDFSVWEIWGCLTTGGRLVVVGEEARTCAADFTALILAEGITVLSQTPTAFAGLMGTLLAAAGTLPVRTVVFGGERLDTRGLLPWLELLPPPAYRLVNMFGITETTVHVTWQLVGRAEALDGSPSVGHPLPGWNVQVVDRDRRPLPPGESGEIAVGGAGLATGYWNRPDLTAERFAPCPVTGSRRYYSGDLGRLLPDGRLEHLGRLDEQVKLRGFRIELGDIRSALLGDDSIAAAAVVLHRPVPGDSALDRLDAYVVAEPGREETARTVRARLTDLLPDYMLPATVTLLPALPLTANGKLDTTALPRPATTPAAPPVLSADNTAPETDGTARLVHDSWSRVLGAPADPDVNFFDAGGNSLLAARLAAHLRTAGLAHTRIKDVLLAPTPAALTRRLTTTT
ncbi:amino acid adenylation domain-containing protein [Kitasatospora cineracea]|uniref:amino acid adenylation domain-containing protein n=1 Tax=Kitasatospora cineracea TaxID=88074 RepID=UPI0037AE320D